MKIVCVGGGPAGLYVALLMKLRHPDYSVTVVERNPAGATYGQGEAQSRLRRSRAVSRGASRGGQLSRPTTLLVSEVAPK